MAQSIIGNSREYCIVAKVTGVRYEAEPFAEQKLATWPGLIPPLEERVKAAEAIAIATAPVESGKYKTSIASEVGYDHRARVIGRLRADDWKAIWIEFGTSKTPAHATLRKAMEATGLKVRLRRRRKR